MNPRLLALYNQELQHVRESAAEFAKEFPKIAGRLTLSGMDCADPYVERLLEGFAYLTARVQLKLDAEYPTFTHNLLEIAYPHYLAPTPSMTVVQMQIDADEGTLAGGFTLQRGTTLRANPGRDAETPCQYRSTQAVTLWPLSVSEADYFGNPQAMLGRVAASEPKAKAGLRITLRTGAKLPFKSLNLDNLPLYLNGADELPFRLYEQMRGNVCAVFAREPDGDWLERLPNDALKPQGFDDCDAALPVVPQAFQGYRLLQEYFALPQRYLFIDFTALTRAVQQCNGEQLELLVLFDRLDSSLENSVSAAQFVPFCTPAINLFAMRVDRIHLSDEVNEHHVIADRTRPTDFEIHSVSAVTGHSTGPEQAFMPFYAVRDPARFSEGNAFYLLHQRTAARRDALYLCRQRNLCQPRRQPAGAVSPGLASTGRQRAVHQPRSAAVHERRQRHHRFHPGRQRPR
jgi:type VI secretion system protein ImpG